jgi:hypothetical protein
MTSIQDKSQQTRTSRYIQHCILKIKVFCDVLSEAQVCDPFYFRKNRLPNRPKFTILSPQPTSWTFDLQRAVSSAVEHRWGSQVRNLYRASSAKNFKTLIFQGFFCVSGLGISSKRKVTHKRCANGALQIDKGPFAGKSVES